MLKFPNNPPPAALFNRRLRLGAGVHEEFGVVEAVLDEMQAAAVFFIGGGEFLRGGIEMGLRQGE